MARSPSAARAELRSLSSSAVTCGSGLSASQPDNRASIRSNAATRKWPEPIAMSAHRKSKNPSAAPASSPALVHAQSDGSICARSVGSRASSSRCSTQKGLVKYEPVALRWPDTPLQVHLVGMHMDVVASRSGDVLLVAAAGGLDGKVVGCDC